MTGEAEPNGVEWRPNRSGPWAAVDAGLLRHPKLERLQRPSARLLYVACVLHCADELTDGHVGAHALPRLLLAAGAKAGDVDALVAGELLDRDPDGDGYLVHGYLDWNPPRSYHEHQRKRNAAKQQAYRDRLTRESQARLRTTGSNRGSNRLRAGNVPGEREKYEVPPYIPPTPTDPSTVCAECGERLGHGHLEDCPRMPRAVA